MRGIKDFIEKFYPIVFSFFIAIIFLLNHSIKILDDVNLVLGSVLTFVSIIIGFMGILITLIFGIQENSILSYILKDEYYKLLAFKYFTNAFTSGFALIIITVVLFFRHTIQSIEFHFIGTIIIIIKCLWVYNLTYFPLASYRIIVIVLKAAFHTDKRIKKSQEKIFNEDEYNQLRDKHQSKK